MADEVFPEEVLLRGLGPKSRAGVDVHAEDDWLAAITREDEAAQRHEEAGVVGELAHAGVDEEGRLNEHYDCEAQQRMDVQHLHCPRSVLGVVAPKLARDVSQGLQS